MKKVISGPPAPVPKPDPLSGTLETEAVLHTAYTYQGGQYVLMGDGDPHDTGRFRWVYDDNTVTPWYTAHQAPAWLLELYKFVQAAPVPGYNDEHPVGYWQRGDDEG